MSTGDFNYMKEGLTADLAGLLVAQNGMSIAEALDVLYNSDTFAKLCDERTGLFFQSAEYVFSYLKNELAFGKMA